MDNGIQLLYNTVLSKLPFSVTGYADIENKLSEFYRNLADSSFIVNDVPEITLLFSALLDIPKDSKKIKEWELENFRHIFYRAIHETDNEKAISFYFHMLYWAGEEVKEPETRLSTSFVLSKFFNADLDFRVHINDDKDASKPIVDFNKNKNLFFITIPKNIFKKSINYNDQSELRFRLDKLWKDSETYLIPIVGYKGSYKLKQKLNDKGYNKVIETLFDLTKVKETVRIIEQKLTLGVGENLHNKEKKLITKVAYCSICLSFLSLYYESYIEYMLSVAKVNNNNEYRNIGGLVFGYKKELDGTHRAILNLISDRLAAAVGGQVLIEILLDEKLKILRTQQKDFLDDFHNKILSDCELAHFNKVINKKDIDKLKNFWSNYNEDYLNKIGLSLFKEFVNDTFTLNSKVGKGMYFCIHSNDPEEKYFKERKLGLYKVQQEITPGLIINGKEEPKINVVLFNKLLDRVKAEKFYYTHLVYFNNNNIKVVIDFKQDVDINHFIRSIRTENKENNKYGDLGDFFIKNYWAFRISGDFEIGIKEGEKFQSLINFSDDIVPVEDPNGKVIKLSCNKEVNGLYKQLVYNITFKSI